MTNHNPQITDVVQVRIRRRLLDWYTRNKRDLPWRRRGTDAYAQMLAELMLQQTQVATVIGYYERFMARFPTIADLAAADLDDVLALWSGLGYYRRARHLHAAARQVVEEHNGVVPSDVASLMNLPGIGRYTAGAIASIAYGTWAPVLDGNVVRVLMRLLAIDDDPKAPTLRERLWSVAESLLPARRCGDFNQALMELGATLCRPAMPVCPECPIRRDCQACLAGLTARIPPPSRRVVVQSAEFVVAAIRRDGRLSFVQRPMTGLWAGLWELPSEPVGPEEMYRLARARLRKRLPSGCRLAGTRSGTTTRQLTHRKITFHVFSGTLPAGPTRPREPCWQPGVGNRPTRWLSSEDLGNVGLSRATCAILEMIGWPGP